jgi:quinoprotein relay system zinc metallohydrolase 2
MGGFGMAASPARPIHASGLSRRHALLGGLCLCCAATAGLSPRAYAEAFTMEEVGPGTFIRKGLIADADADNLDAIANIGFIVGKTGVLVTESGGSLADGEWLRRQIAQRTTKPITHVVLTHVHPDHAFGAGAFAADKPVFIGHAKLKEALDARGEFYRQRLVELFGADKTGPVVYPTMTVADTAEIDLGDRRLGFTAHGPAHTTSDLSMRDSLSGLLFPADLLFVERIPSLDGSLKGWLRELERVKAMGAAQAVPGHGPVKVDLAPAVAELTAYLTALRDQTKAAIAKDVPIDKAVDTVAQDQSAHWKLFEHYNRRNVTVAYQELEWD